MNKRLLKLYNKAVKSVPDDTEEFDDCMIIFTENVTKLIVAECVKIANKSKSNVGSAIEEYFRENNDND
jgi:hypothetical protein